MLALLVLLPASASAEPTTRIIVKRDPGLSGAEQRDIRADAGATLVERLSVPRLEVVSVPRSEVSSALRTLRGDPDVAQAEVDATYHELADPYMDFLWGFDNTGPPQKAYRLQDNGPPIEYDPTAGADISVLDGWTKNLDDGLSLGRGHTVAVVDSGVKADQEDLLGRIAHGYDWVDEDADAADPRGHGTHVAGIVAANRGNAFGAAGVAPEARILPLRILNADGAARASDIIDAFHFADEQGVRIVNASFGATVADPLLRSEIDTHPNTLFVTAAGNSGANDDNPATTSYPCAYDLDNVLCVGATDALDEKPDWSNYGANTVDVYAPGEGIFSTWIGASASDKYALASGTSMAAPHIAGLAALLLARNPSLTTDQLKGAITSTADTPAGLVQWSGKRANALAALTSVDADRDGDGVLDDSDNCPDVKNPAPQMDTDIDGIGDECDPDTPASAPDSDEDHVLDADDDCDYEPATTPNGCPGDAPDSNHDGLPDMFDDDNDGVRNISDNCPSVASSSQTDSDNDGLGDVCDSTPRGPDSDGDGKPLLDDQCPTIYALTSNGCPVPVTPAPAPAPGPVDSDGDGLYNPSDGCPYEYAKTGDGCPLPAVTSLSARANKRHGKARATISVRSSRAATVQVTVQIRKCKHHHCRWARVTRKTTATVGGRATVKTGRLKRGKYRAVIVLSSSAGRASAERQYFRVR